MDKLEIAVAPPTRRDGLAEEIARQRLAAWGVVAGHGETDGSPSG